MPTPLPFVYAAKILSVHDGDSMEAELDLGFRVFHRVDVRLAGLDTPEVTGASKAAGLAVRDFVREQVAHSRNVTVESRELDKYGRSLAIVYLGSTNLNRLLLDNGLALAYSGDGLRPLWSAAQLLTARTVAEGLTGKE